MSQLHKKTVGLIKQLLDAIPVEYKETEGGSNEGDCTSLQFSAEDILITIDIQESTFEFPRED